MASAKRSVLAQARQNRLAKEGLRRQFNRSNDGTSTVLRNRQASAIKTNRAINRRFGGSSRGSASGIRQGVAPKMVKKS